jgi:hypothetical protein
MIEKTTSHFHNTLVMNISAYMNNCRAECIITEPQNQVKLLSGIDHIIFNILHFLIRS